MPVERMVAAALDLVDEKGAEALSLRALAQRLGSSTSTIYRHFASRAELVAQVVDHLMSEIEIDESTLGGVPWGDAYRSLAGALFEVLARHPRAAPLLLEQLPTGPNAMAYRELGLTIMLRAGVPERTAARFVITMARYVLGFAMQLQAEPGQSGEHSDLPPFTRVDSERFPATASVAQHLPASLDEEFNFGLDLLIRGLGVSR